MGNNWEVLEKVESQESKKTDIQKSDFKVWTPERTKANEAIKKDTWPHVDNIKESLKNWENNTEKWKENGKKTTSELFDWVKTKSEKISEKIKWIKDSEWNEISIDKLSKMETSELLKMEVSDRLNLVTAWDKKIERGELKEWKEIEFNFSQNGNKNENLYLNTSAGQVLPVEIWTVNVGGVEYQRHWYEWEFFNDKWERLLIDDWTKITIWKPRTGEEIKEIAWKITEDYNKLTKELGIDTKKIKEWDKEKLDIIRESLKKWLSQSEIKTILDWNYQDLNKIEPLSRKKEVFKTLMDLKNKGVLDWDVSWKKIDRKELETFAEKYWIPADAMWIWSGWHPEYTSQTPPNLNFPEWTPEQLKKTINAAMWELWVHENSWKADKFFHETWFPNLDARSTPWCAAFINWALKEWWLEWTWSNLAKSFIKWAWKWHVWFNVWGQLLWWNQSNRVSLKPLNYWSVEWWILPTEKDVKPHTKWPFNKDNIPEWAIVVFGRGKNTT